MTDFSSAFCPHINVCELVPSTSVEGYYILQSAMLKTTASGKPYLSASISDRTGTITVIIWNYSGPISSADDGKIVHVHGLASEFKGNLQVTLDSIRLKNEDESIDLSVLVPVAPIDLDQMFSEISSLLNTLTDDDYRAVCLEFLSRHQDSFLNIPAAKSVHHSFLHGLLMHTGNMLRTANQLASLYRDTIDRNLLLAGTFLHDFSKREEFTFSQLGLVSGYSTKGQLLGHLVMGAQEVAEISAILHIPEQKSILLQHMLLSHHGKPEYGAAVIPMCAEADLLSMIDMIDSRMEIYRENLERIPLGEFSDRIFALDGNRIYHHYEPSAL